jgi:D-glycero-D-manno-heptose 1,7-bisphosphate phosphatase
VAPGTEQRHRNVSNPHPVEGGCAGETADSAPRRGACSPRPAACPERSAALDSRNGRPPHAGRPAVFLDRDGVINDQTSFVNTPDDFRLLPGAAAAIRRLNEAGIPVVVTNQGGIALGYLTEDDLAAIHHRMADLLAAEGAHVDAVYYSPYFPNGAIPRYAKDSPDRKPGIGMLERARDELGIDLRKSFLVGDATTDILAGLRAGCTTILVQTGQAGTDGKEVAEPNHVAADLGAAVDLILDRLAPVAT